VLVLASCIGIESSILLRQDGSGSLTLSYTVSQYIKNIDAERSAKQLPLPVNEEEFRRSVQSIEGLRLTSLEQREDQENVYIRAELEFDSLDAVNALGAEGQMGISLETQNGTKVFRQVIYEPQEGEEITGESLAMVETFFQGYELVYSLTVPSEVRSNSLGTLGADRRTVEYRVTVADILKSTKPLVLEVVW
jgi:hypothetical protein